MAAVAAFALSSGGFLAAFWAFLLFAVTMAALMVLVTLFAGTSQHLLRPLRASGPAIQRGASIVLLLVGAGLIYITFNPGPLFP